VHHIHIQCKRKVNGMNIIFDTAADPCESWGMKKPALGGLWRFAMDAENIRYFALQLAKQMLPEGTKPDDVIALATKLAAFIKGN